MTASPEVRSLWFYVREYRRYILPTWLLPVYFIAWGITCQWLKLRFGTIAVLFFVTVGPPFIGVSLWASRARKYIPFGQFSFLTQAVPFFIAIAIALLLAVAQEVFGKLPFQ